MPTETNCPKCRSENIYVDGHLWICPECGHEWTTAAPSAEAGSSAQIVGEDRPTDSTIRDAFGTPLATGDSVTVIKELKIKGSSSVVKVGTKVKNIKLGDGGDGHDIACRIDGLGSIHLKSEFVKKA